MDDVIRGALIGILGILLGVSATELFALLRDRKREQREKEQEQREKESFRTLLSLELLQNATALLIFRAALVSTLKYDDSIHITTAFIVTAVPPHWEMARWNALETGRHLNPSELLRIGEWYTKLDGATFLFERLMEQLRRLPLSNGKLAINPTVGDHAAEQIRDLVDYVEDLRANPPPLPDTKLNSGESVREYLEDLQRRHPDAPFEPELLSDAVR